MTEKPLWQPSPDRIRQSRTDAFRRFIEERHSLKLAGYDALYRWSVEAIEPFWEAVWDFCGVIGDRQGPTLIDGDKMPGAAFFPQARINWAENLLRQTGDSDAIIFQGEDKAKRRLTWRQLHDLVSRLQQALAAEGIGEGDIVAGFMPNLPETAAAAIATASLGAVWTSCSPDFGTAGVLDRFGQVAPKLLFAPDGYFYAGKTIDVRARVAEFVQQLPSVKRLVSVSYIGDGKADTALKQAKTLADFVAPFAAKPVTYRRVAFNAPLFVMYSSGTTGKPKCIVHGVGGTLLQHMKEHQLQCDVRPMDRVLYFTTCGWMMWNWQVSALASGASLLLYDGSPFHPSGEVLWDYAEREKATLFGTSAKYLDASAKAGVVPKDKFPLASVRTLCSTGSPLAPEGFDYVYDKVKSDICLSSISGGTDIIGCFVGGNPIGPVWRGQIQARHLAMAVQVFDEEGRALIEEKGELVCTKPFPSMPIYFWDDAKGERYFNAYFARFKNIWCHGDYVALTKEGGMVVFGRSDATLNPGGVRIGTAEIYRQVEQLPEVLESIVIGQNWDNDVRVVLFVKLKPGLSLDEALVKKIKTQIREGCTPRHVPAKVLQVEDIPRTKSGKIVELAVRDVVEGRAVKNKEALANPEALAHFEKRAELAS